MKEKDNDDLNRRDFIKLGTAATIGATIIGSNILSGGCTEKLSPSENYMGDYVAPKIEKIRCGFIGVGARGGGHLFWAADNPNAEIVAISDPHIPTVEERMKQLKERNKQNVKVYSNGDKDYLRMLKDENLDAVFVSTPWEWHAKQAIATMESGAHVFVEVPLAVSMEELWQIIETSERTQKHCMMMENVNYGREELMYLNMCRQNVIGELLHGEASYIHELRGQMFQEDHGTGSWRTLHYSKRNGNLYPTHGLGPVAQYMNIARTEDLFSTIVSYSSPAIGRKLFAENNFGKDHKWNKIGYNCGDINTSIIKTKLGRTILLQWDETSPRPYSRLNLIQGTKGTLAGFPTRIALDGQDYHHWMQGEEELQPLYEKYEHPLWVRVGEEAVKAGGHGGMDYIMRYRIFECLMNGEPLDQNVYEGAFWSAAGILSEESVKENGELQEFPDFTRGAWKNTKPLEIIGHNVNQTKTAV